MQLQNSIGEMSCVYEAFLDAGLPAKREWIKTGVIPKKIFSLFRKHGYEVHKKEDGDKPFFVSIKSDESFFVLRVWDDGGHHLEHHDGLDVVTKYDPKTICAIAKKK